MDQIQSSFGFWSKLSPNWTSLGLKMTELGFFIKSIFVSKIESNNVLVRFRSNLGLNMVTSKHPILKMNSYDSNPRNQFESKLNQIQKFNMVQIFLYPIICNLHHKLNLEFSRVKFGSESKINFWSNFQMKQTRFEAD